MRRLPIILISIIGLTMVILIYIIVSYINQKPSRFIWNKSYQDSKIEPYDFGVFKRLIEDKSGIMVLAEDNLSQTLTSHEEVSSYVFIGRNCYLRQSEVEHLLRLADEGKQVLIISEGFPDTLLQALSYKLQTIKTSVVNEAIVGVKSLYQFSLFDSLTFRYREHQLIGKTLTDWHVFDVTDQSVFGADSGAIPYLSLSRLNGQLNAIKFKHGRGSITLNSSPMLFSNLAMQSEQIFLMTSELMSGMDLTCVVYDAASREQKVNASNIHRSSDSPLSYILAQASFRWAWYVFIGTVLAFFVFKAKRKQRIIPVIQQKSNTTLEFIDTLSALYYQSADYGKMAQTRMHLFLYFIRYKLGVSTQEINEDCIQMISHKSAVNKEIIQSIFNYYNTLKIAQVSPEQLMALHRRIEQFYHQYYSKN